MRGLVSLALALIVIAVAAPSVSAGIAPTIQRLSVTGSPFAADWAPLPDRAAIGLNLRRAGRATVSVLRPNGTLVRRLASGVRLARGMTTWTWDGRNDAAQLVANGKYVVRAVVKNATTGTERISEPVRKGLPPIFPANPGMIVVAVDAGHGGRYPGAVNGEFMEKDFNLDISLKLRSLLERAGVQVVMSRTTDNALDEPPTDNNGDGSLDRYDDDLLRVDSKNQARADVAVHVHNNASSNPERHGTSTWIDPNRPWTPQARELATVLLEEELAALAQYRSALFVPRNAGVNAAWYYYMGPYDPPFLVRSSLVTSVLSESLFVSNASELEALRRPELRTSLAAAIYLGLSRWLNSRELGVGYALVSGPSSVAAGSAAQYKVRVTNRGNVPTDEWTLQLGIVPQVPVYDGSGAHGTLIGSTPVPDGLAPGQSAELTVDTTVPSEPGSWLVKSDVVLVGGAFASDSGVVPLQVGLTTTSP